MNKNPLQCDFDTPPPLTLVEKLTLLKETITRQFPGWRGCKISCEGDKISMQFHIGGGCKPPEGDECKNLVQHLERFNVSHTYRNQGWAGTAAIVSFEKNQLDAILEDLVLIDELSKQNQFTI